MGSTPAPRPSTYRRARRAVGRWRRSVADPDDLRGTVRAQRERLDRQATEIAELKSTVGALRKRLHPVERASTHRELEHGRVAVQVGIAEERIGALEERLEQAAVRGSDEDAQEGRTILAEIRREHQQVRVRMQVIAQYEERLRRVEQAVGKLYEGDVRHPF